MVESCQIIGLEIVHFVFFYYSDHFSFELFQFVLRNNVQDFDLAQNEYLKAQFSQAYHPLVRDTSSCPFTIVQVFLLENLFLLRSTPQM